MADDGDLAIMLSQDGPDGWSWRLVDVDGAVQGTGGAADQGRALKSALKAAGVHVRSHRNIILGQE